MNTANIKNQLTKNYYVYYVKTSILKNVSRKTFIKIKEAQFYQVGNNYIKVFGSCNRKCLQSLFSGYFAESMFENVSDCYYGIKTILNFATAIGKYAKHFNRINLSLCSKIVSLLLKIVHLVTNKSWDVVQIIILFIDIYNIVSDSFVPESLDAFLLAGLSCFLPPVFSDLLRRVQMFSSVKLCDDYSLLYKFIISIMKVLEYLETLSPFLKGCFQPVKKVMELFSLSPKHILLYEIEKIIVSTKDPKFFVDIKNRQTIFTMDEKLSEIGTIEEWSRRSNKVRDILNSWKRVVRIARNQDAVIRKEPTAFIFEGPPGCRKSVIMNRLIEALNEPCYSHLVKATSDGKDWYDCYNNETIFYMDDVGQQGASQWRTLINMVSPVRLPLDCAAAELKDTKFFNSEKIFVTTNSFSGLNGLCKQDCISDVRALWRRGVVFDFATVKPKGDEMTGRVVLKHYNTLTDKWEMGPHAFVVEKVPKLGTLEAFYNFTPQMQLDGLIKWLMLVVKGYDIFKDKVENVSQLDDVEGRILRESVNNYYAEVLENFYDVHSHPQYLSSQTIRTISNNDLEDIISRLEREWLDSVERESTELDNTSEYDGLLEVETYNTSYLKSFYTWFLQWFPDFIRIKISDYVIPAFSKISEGLGSISESIFMPVVMQAMMQAVAYCIILGITYILLYGFEIVSSGVKSAHTTITSLFNRSKWEAQMCKFAVENAHNSVERISRSSFKVRVETDAGALNTYAIVSGRTIIVPAHSISVGMDTFISIGAHEKDAYLVEHERVEVVYIDNKEDVAVLKLPSKFPSPFKKISQWFKDDCGDFDFCSYLISGPTIVSLSSINGRHAGSTHQYSLGNWKGTFVDSDLMYDIHGEGMCGSVVFSTQQGIRGFHVAGNSSSGRGVAKLWSLATIKELRKLCESDNFLPNFVMKPSQIDESVVRIDPVTQTNTCSNTEFGPSPLFGIFPVTRSPANLRKFGRNTVKVVAKKSFQRTRYLSNDELNFGKNVMRVLIPEFNDISQREVVLGNELLAPLNKDSSNGLLCNKEKEDYIDFTNGKYTDLLIHDLESIRKCIKEGEFPLEAMLWSECLKDEIRNDEKDGMPRSFRISTIHNQVLCKEKFGGMVSKIMEKKFENGIMIGINPFKEWDILYNTLKTCVGSFSADTKLWDGGMLPQVQRAVADIVLEKYKGEEKDLCEVLLESLVHTILMIMDEGYITTHSFPSGHYLTAIMNSLVNRFYTACWYYRECVRNGVRPTVDSFLYDVVDFVYGDDKLNGVRRYPNFLNALTLRNFFQSIGLDLTNADKSEIVAPFNNFDDLDFLKRKFVYHRALGRIMCPLSLRTLKSGLSYVNLSKDINVVMHDKLHNYVREIYLHQNYNELLEELKDRLLFYKYSFNYPSEEYLYNLYLIGDIDYASKYM